MDASEPPQAQREAQRAPARPPAKEPPRASASRTSRAGGATASVQDGALSTMRSAMEAAERGERPARLSDEEIRVERANTLRAKDPVLGAAIDALDLELLD